MSRERGLSVIEPEGRGKQYAEWAAEQAGRPTLRGTVRADIDAALVGSASLPDLFTALEVRGYTVKRGPGVKHTSLRPPGGQRFLRLDSLGEGYSESGLQARMAAVQRGETHVSQPMARAAPLPVKYYRLRGPRPIRGHKFHGLRALYVKYLYLLGKIPVCKPSKGAAFLLRGEVVKFNRYVAQFRLIQRYRIETTGQLGLLADALQAEIDALTDRRKAFYQLSRRGRDDGTVTQAISAATARIRCLRRDHGLCTQALGDLPRIQSQVPKPQEKERGRVKEDNRHVKNRGHRSR